MKGPNWEEAPEGATHWEPESDSFMASFMRKRGDSWECFLDGKWKPDHIDSSDAWRVALFVERPWTGEGLPPVGTVCEIAASTQYLTIRYQEGMKVKVYANFTDDRGVELAAWVSDKAEEAGVCTAKCFRPIRTPEQIALEERNQRVSEIMGIVKGLDLRFLTESHAHHVAVALYDAGYRKAEGGAQ